MIGVAARDEEHDVVGEFFELFKTPWELYRDDGGYDVLICADDVVRHHSAKLVIVYGSQPTAFDRETKSFLGSQRHGATLSWNGDRIPVYERCVTFAPVPDVPDLVLEDTREPVVAVTRVDTRIVVRVGYDLFREIRFLLTTGQPPMHAGIPTLERHIAFLRTVIVGAGIPLVEIPPIPASNRFMACLTHDIDHPSIRLHRFDHTAFGFLYRAIVGSLINVCRRRTPLATLWRNWAAALRVPFVHLGLARDFWLQFNRYLEIEKGLGSTFFVIPVKHDSGRTVDGPASKMRASSYGVSDIADHLKPLRVAGCEVALHGIDAWLDSAKGVEERERVSRVTGACTAGVRMHWLFFDDRAPRRLDEAGFTYDSTYGYNETVGFRAGTMQAFRPIGARRLLELPLTIMDTALFYPAYRNLTPSAARRVVWQLMDDAERDGGVLVINWHDRSLAPERLWGNFYIEMVEELKGRGAWCPTARQAASWFAQRRSAVFDAVHWEDSSLRVKVTATARDVALPGLMVRVYTPHPRDLPFGTDLDTHVALGLMSTAASHE